MSTPLFWHRRIWTFSLIMRILFSTSSSVGSSTKSVLLRMIRSAKAICSTASFSTPSGFSSSRCSMTCFASTSVRMPSRSNFCWTKSSAKKVCATGAGSARPVVSMMIPSKGLSFFWAFFTSFFRPAIRSPRTVQQMQPLFISTMFSSVRVGPSSMSASSMPTSPNSFSMTASRLPWFSFSIRFKSVVFPEPKNPVSTVTGTLLGFATLPEASSSAFAFLAEMPASAASSGWTLMAQS
mmetsp:Transcript_99058/g.174757  ORF Transcript_99058/g.174757 Transcript_99058/m.174757 type:complete len:238 (-) Transcript_99058:398-1111(-)